MIIYHEGGNKMSSKYDVDMLASGLVGVGALFGVLGGVALSMCTSPNIFAARVLQREEGNQQ